MYRRPDVLPGSAAPGEDASEPGVDTDLDVAPATVVGAGAVPEPLAGASIRVVANRTGIAADTLRVWERRYGFPQPSRRAGGSRVYTEGEVARLHLIARAIASGFRPSEVVTLPPDELAKLVDASVADAPRAPAPTAFARALLQETAQSLSAAPSIDALIEALKSDDLPALRALLRTAALALGPRAFVTDLAHPLALRVGELWAQKALDVRHEHVASAALTSQLHLLLGALDDGVRAPTVLLATLPGEPHVLGIDMVAVYLAAQLAGPRVLGGDTPPAQILEAARALSVDVVGLSISPVADGQAVARATTWLATQLPPGVELWLGGGGARAVAASTPTAVIVSTWPELDHALAALRARTRARPRAR